MKCDHKHLKSKALLRWGAGLLVAVSLPILAHSSYYQNAYLQSCNSPIANLQAEGVQVIHLGETYRLVISSSQLFHTDSANLLPGASTILDNVASLLKAHHIVTVKVAAYSDNVKPGPRKRALTAAQAAAVQGYLSNRDSKARLIYADGQGEQNPVAWNGTRLGRHANRRVEISFMVIPTTTMYTVKVKK